jgi:type VI protein secretion system component VasK
MGDYNNNAITSAPAGSQFETVLTPAKADLLVRHYFEKLSVSMLGAVLGVSFTLDVPANRKGFIV